MPTDRERDLRERLREGERLFPDYGGRCFAHVPDTVRSVLGDEAERPLPHDVLEGVGEDNGESDGGGDGDEGGDGDGNGGWSDGRFDRVLLLLVDGFGLAYWRRFADHPLLERFEEVGTVSPLTSIYPSETAAALTTLHTGRLPASHGVLGWYVYDPADDAAYEAFTVDVRAGDESVADEMDLEDVYEGEAIYPSLCAAGIESRHVVPFEETYEGAIAHTYDLNLEGGTFESALADAFEAADDPAYLYAYLPQVDTAAHRYGTTAAEYEATVSATLDALERAVDGLGSAMGRGGSGGPDGETLVLLTADHGHVDTDPERNVDLESAPFAEPILESLRCHADGEPVRYAGSPRNLHLHLRDDAGESAAAIRARLESELDARVFTRTEALERDLFGDGERSETFERRVGDLVVCHRDLSVWYGSDPLQLSLVGMHGGLHPDEMLVPFAAATLENLRR
ncbi:alkaline phosphatase family protein [Natrialbaceae archaeon GCM10025810]|uniref:alkaline phosphatase family protein n=1 Tax=Halovalidus salilacus TaxID=3075124 RepID=UPI003623DB68